MTTVWIRADASSALGIGHVMRTMAIAEEAARSGCRVRYLCRPDPILESVFAGRDVEFDVVQDEAWPSRVQRLDAVVLDGYELSPAIVPGLRERRARIGRIDDGEGGSFDADVLLNPNNEEAEYRLPGHATALLGPRHALLRREIRKRRDGRRRGSGHLLLAFGGTDPLALGSAAVEVLMERRVFASVELLLGPGSPPLALEAPGWLTVTRAPPDAGAVLARAGAAISAAGSTTWELFYLGIPTALVKVAPNQEPVVSAATRVAAAEVIADPAEFRQCLPRVLEVLSDPARRLELISNAQGLVDGRGAERFLDALLAAPAP